MNKYFKIALAVGAVVAAGSAGAAASVTTTLPVSATVLASCTVTALPLNFGNYTPGTQLDGATSIDVRCTGGTTYDIGLDGGGAGAAAVTARRMASGANLLEYALYTDAGRSDIWGNTIGTDTETGTGTGLAIAGSRSVYGRVLNSTGNANAAAGVFTDTVNVTVTY
jgi:spore coat protein U-like protein